MKAARVALIGLMLMASVIFVTPFHNAYGATTNCPMNITSNNTKWILLCAGVGTLSASRVVQAVTNTASGGTSITCSLPMMPNEGAVVAVGTTSVRTWSSITDTMGLSWVAQTCVNGGLGYQACITAESGPANPTNGVDVITVSFTVAFTGVIYCYAFNAGLNGASGIAGNAGTTAGTNVQVTSSTPLGVPTPSGGIFTFLFMNNAGASPVASAGNDIAWSIDPQGTLANTPAANFYSSGEWWASQGSGFNQVIIPVYVTQGCTFFQLQCWAYPLMFMGMYEGFFIGVGAAFRVSEKSFIYLLLTGATFCSLIEVVMGIMTPMLPIILIVLNIAYSFRIDKIIGGAVSRGRAEQT